MPGSPKWSPFLRFPHQNHAYASHPPIRATCPANLIRLYLITRKILGEEYRSLSSSLCSLLYSPCHLVPLRPKYSSQHPFSNTLSLRSSLNVSDQVSHTYKTTGKIIFQYILIYIFLDSTQHSWKPNLFTVFRRIPILSPS